jgi:hypothetical protein
MPVAALSRMMTEMKKRIRKTRGIALLAVLMIIIVITIVALSFISRSDGELAYGQNTKLHTQVDNLAESGLAHAKALILNPQDADLGGGEYWTGANGQQLSSGDLSYDVSIRRHASGTTPLCSFDVTSSAYKLSGSEHVAESTFAAELRLDPCIALWIGGNGALDSTVTVNGDVYCGASFTSVPAVNGDIYAIGAISAPAQGQKNPLSASPIFWPPVNCSTLAPTYYASTTICAATVIDANSVTAYSSMPSAGNPAGVVYHVGDLELNGPASINGTLVVTGDLTIRGQNNLVTAARNYPAIVVGGHLIISSNSSLTVNGLVLVYQNMYIPAGRTNIQLTVNGGLFIAQSSMVAPVNSTVNITADHSKTALMLWGSSGTPVTWRQAGGAFYKNLRRQP